MKPLALCLLAAATLFAQPPAGTTERIKVHGKSLEGNLSGDAPDRDVSVYLPPSYKSSPARRYPALYMLHGFTDSDAQWMGFTKHWINLPEVLDKAIAAGAPELIVVMPNAFTRFHGSMYSSSVTTGDWETYVAVELVAHVDAHYRTLTNRASRGLAGHSMGGYGAMRIGMKNPGVFAALYLLSPCCMAPPQGGVPASAAAVEAVESVNEIAKAGFGVKAQLASAAAWSPNPKNPPFFIDLPYLNGEARPAVLARWAANAPLAMLDQYLANLKRLRGIAFDAGDRDAGIAATIKTLDQVLSDYALPHDFEIYEGDHLNRIAARIETKLLPFFGKHLELR